jgi:hypothetical protein
VHETNRRSEAQIRSRFFNFEQLKVLS